MIKRILLTIVMLLLIAYLVAAVTVFNDKPAHQVCRDMELVIKDTLNAGFVTKNEVAAILQKKGIYPVGKKMDRVHTKTLEKELDKHPLINEAQCYKSFIANDFSTFPVTIARCATHFASGGIIFPLLSK